MPTELGYVRGTVDQFVHRIEDRSSLLQMAGHDVEDGQLVEFFEFRHLTFQEFLIAQAMVKGWHRDAKETDTLVNVLEPHFGKEEWCEVIPLAAVLGGKKTEALIQKLTTNCLNLRSKPIEYEMSASKNHTQRALMNCLADEASARPETIQAAIRELVYFGRAMSDMPAISMLIRGRYGADFTIEARKAFLASKDYYIVDAAWALSSAVWCKALESTLEPGGTSAYELVAEQFVQLLASEDDLTRCEGALGCVRLLWRLNSERTEKSTEIPRIGTTDIKHIHKAGPALVKMLFSELLPVQYAATWAVGWLGIQGIAMPTEADIIGRLYLFCQKKNQPRFAQIAAGALVRQPIWPRETKQQCYSISRQEFLHVIHGYDEWADKEMKLAILIVAWYLAALSDTEIAKRVHILYEGRSMEGDQLGRRIDEFLNYLVAPQEQNG
jgi:hypothetical protein